MAALVTTRKFVPSLPTAGLPTGGLGFAVHGRQVANDREGQTQTMAGAIHRVAAQVLGGVDRLRSAGRRGHVLDNPNTGQNASGPRQASVAGPPSVGRCFEARLRAASALPALPGAARLRSEY